MDLNQLVNKKKYIMYLTSYEDDKLKNFYKLKYERVI